MRSQTRTIGRNVVWNWIGVIANVAAGFLIAPFLVHRLNDTGYGLWIYIGSLTGYFGLLDLGVRGSVGRYLAYYGAQGDRRRMNEVFSAAVGILVVTGAVGALAVWMGRDTLLSLVAVPAATLPSARTALALVGLNLGLALLLNVFDATLWANQRFDLLNAIDIPVTAIRLALTFWFVGHGGGLVALASITLLATLLAGLAKLVATLVEDRQLRVDFASVSRGTIRLLFDYGFWNLIRTVGQMTRKTLSPVIIGAWLGLAAVTPFSLAASLVGYTLLLVIAGTGVLVPVATRLHAQKDAAQQARLLLDGGKACFALGLFFVTAFVLLGPSFIRLWVGARLGAAATLLAILAAGELLPMAQYATETILLGTAEHRPLAWFAIAEAVLGAGLAIAAMTRFGLTGACVALAVSATACRGFGTLALGLRACRVGLGAYVKEVILPSGAALTLPAACLAGLVAVRAPGSWIALVGFGALFFVLSCGGAVWLIGWDVVRRNLRVVAGPRLLFSRARSDR